MNGIHFSSHKQPKMKDIDGTIHLKDTFAFFQGVLEPSEPAGNIFETQRSHLHDHPSILLDLTFVDFYLKNGTTNLDD